MELNTYIMIGIAVLSMFFGYFFGLFEGRGQGYKKRKKEEQAGMVTETTEDEPESQAAPQPIDQPDLPAMPLEPSLMRLSQDLEGHLHLDLDDKRVDTTALTPDQRGRLIALLSAMRPWLEAGRPAFPAPTPRPRSAQVQPAASRPEPAPSLASVNRLAAAPAEKPAAADEPPTSPQSIVGQIDSILQMRIAGTALHDKGIKLQESPEGGVLVWVGLSKFQTVDEVPDEAIKSAIRAAIVEWEDKYTPSG